MARRNLATSLRRRRCPHPMMYYDRLPAELRLWLAGAALPWSPRSALKLWQRFERECRGDAVAMRRRLDQAEARMLARDAPRIWGMGYPPAEVTAGRGASVTAVPRRNLRGGLAADTAPL